MADLKLYGMKAAYTGGALTAVVGACEQPVPATKCHRADRPFGGIVVDLDRAVVDGAAIRDGTRDPSLRHHRDGQR